MNKSTLPTTIVVCPTCNAPKYGCCKSKNGKYSPISHAARVKAYRAAIKVGVLHG